MRPSLSRFLWTRVLVPAALVNFGVNYYVADKLRPPGRRVPLFGPDGVAVDTLVNATIIGLITLLVVVPTTRREAERGLIRGRGQARGWLAVARQHPLLAAVTFGALTALTLGAPAVATLAARGVESFARPHFLLFRALFATVSGLLTALAAVWVALASTPDTSDDPRWCRDPARPVGGATYPFDYIDKGGLAITSREHGCSGTPTWQLVVDGALDPAHVRRALADVVTRYPSLTTRVQALDGVPPAAARYRYAHDPAFQLDAIFEVVDLRDHPHGLPELVHQLHNRHLDLFTDYPLTLTLVITGEETCRLVFRQHHAIADGRAFINLLGDFSQFLDAARAGRRPPAEALAPVGRRSELEALDLPTGRRIGWTLQGIGWLMGALVRPVRRPLVLLKQNVSNDYTGDNGTVHWHLSDEVLPRWQEAHKRIGVSLNSMLTGALFAANQRWHAEMEAPVGRTRGALVMETRPRGGGFVSFANHLSTLDVEIELDRVRDPKLMAQQVQAQVETQRKRSMPAKRLLAERTIALGLPLAVMQKIVFEAKRPSYSINFSNLIALELPPLGGAGWRVEDVLVTTPITPRIGMVLTVIRYGGRLIFNFNYKSSAASRADAEALCRHFQAVMAELTMV